MHLISVQCPWCFETVEVSLDPDSTGEMFQDCEVCCRPWQMRVETARGDSAPVVRVERG